MIKKLNAIVIATFFTGFSLGFAEDTDGWESEIVAGLNLDDGNSESLNAHVGFNTKNISGANETTLSIGGKYGETGDDTTTENASGLLNYKRHLSDVMYGYGSASALYDDIAMIDYRFMIGPGVGYRVLNDDAVKLNLELGVSWVTEDVAEVEDDYMALRVGQTYDRKLSDTSRVWESIEWIPEIDDIGGNYLINAAVGIDTKINDDMDLRVAVTDRYDSEPAAGSDKNDVSVIAGLVYKL